MSRTIQFSDVVDVVVKARMVPRHESLPSALAEMDKWRTAMALAVMQKDAAAATIAAAKAAAALRIVGRLFAQQANAGKVDELLRKEGA